VKLNQEQQLAVDLPIDATVKIVAGAGTGKTSVLVERYLKFVFEDGVDPGRLLALTFTKKAAAEMHGRVFERVIERGDKRLVRSLYSAWIMNFHQFAFRVIKENAAAFAIDPDTQIASKVDVVRIRRSLERRFEAGTIDRLPDNYEDDVPVPSKMDKYFDRCRKIVDKARGTLWTHDMLLSTFRRDDLPAYRRYLDTIIAVWHAYESDLHSQLLHDFSDLIRIVVDQFTHNNALRQRYANRFEHILVDEFQDTSEAQNELIRLLSGKDSSRVTVVGDEKQSIYRWREARVENIRRFKGKEMFLQTNYRSTQGILDLAFHVLVEDPYFREQADNIRLQAYRGEGQAPISVFHPKDGSVRSSAEEARALGAWILSITGALDSGSSQFAQLGDTVPRLGFGDIAILMRTLKPSSGLPAHEKELQRLGIPYSVTGGVSALEEQVLELFKNVLRLLIYPRDIVSFLSILEAKPFLIPDKAIHQLLERKGKSFHVVDVLSGRSLEQIEDAQVRCRLGALHTALEDLDGRRARLDLPAFVTEAMELTQFFYQLFAGGADMPSVDTISGRMFELVEYLIGRNEANVAALIEAVETLLSEKQLGEDDAPYMPKDRVAIMTQHQAKGLEFKAVAIPGIKNASRTSDGFYLIKGEGLYLSDGDNWNRGTKDNAAVSKEKQERIQEERCLLYVAMTRAKDHLFLSSPFANGMEKNKKENLLAAVLRSLHETGIDHREWRDVPQMDARAHPPAKLDRSTELSKWLDQWQGGRDRQAEARVVRKPVSRGLQFVSWRGLHDFGHCPLTYYFRDIAGIQDERAVRSSERDLDSDDTEKDAAAFPAGMEPEEYGTFVHRFLCEWLSGDEAAGATSRELVLDLAARFELKSKVRDKAVGLTLELIEKYKTQAPWKEEGVFKLEWPVQARLADVIFHGVIDRVDRDGDGLRIIDYKVGTQREEYLYQIRFYAWILNRVLEEPVTDASIVYLHRQPDIINVDVSVAELDRIESCALRLADAKKHGEYPSAPGMVCRGCSFREMCPDAAS